MKFEIIFLGLIVLMARADYIYTYSKPLQLVPTTTYATTSSYYMPGQTTISSFTKTAPIFQTAQANVQSGVAPTLIQTQSYMQPANILTTSTTRYSLTQGTNTFLPTSSTSYTSYPTTVAPTFMPTPAPSLTLTSAPAPASAPTIAPASAVDQFTAPTYISSLSPTSSMQIPTTQMPQSLSQSISTQSIYPNSLTSQAPTYSTTNYMSGTNNAISGINNSGSGNNNLISGTSNCLTGDSNILLGGNNMISGSSNTILGSQNYVTGSSNTVMGLPSSLPTTTNLIMSPDVIVSGTLPPSPTSLLI